MAGRVIHVHHFYGAQQPLGRSGGGGDGGGGVDFLERDRGHFFRASIQVFGFSGSRSCRDRDTSGLLALQTVVVKV